MAKKEILYPSADKIIELNALVLLLIPEKKKDQHKVLSLEKLRKILKKYQEEEGDLYDKATSIMIGLVRGHVFASGNRRTAFIVTKKFLINNKKRFKISNKEENSRIMLGIREGFYEDKEIKEWIKNGKIRKFKRH